MCRHFVKSNSICMKCCELLVIRICHMFAKPRQLWWCGNLKLSIWIFQKLTEYCKMRPNVLPLFVKTKGVSNNWCFYHLLYPFITSQVQCRWCDSRRVHESQGRRLLRGGGAGGGRDRPALRWVPWAGSKESRRGQGKVQGAALVPIFGVLVLGCIDANFFK